MEFLQIHDASLEDRLTYAKLLYSAAKIAGNALALTQADQTLLDLRPNLPGTTIRRLETAILTLDEIEPALTAFRGGFPESQWDDNQRLLVACAYILIDQEQDAGKWLNTIDKSGLGLRDSAMFDFARLAWFVRMERIEEARKQLMLVNREELFPSHVARLEAIEFSINNPDPSTLDQ